MTLNKEETSLMKNTALIGLETPDAPERRTEVIRGIKAKVGDTLNDTLRSLFETFNARYPHGVDYILGGDNIEGVNYLRIDIGGEEFFVTCTRNNVNMDSEHISISIYSNTDFYYSQCKKLDITKAGKLSIWFSSEGARSPIVKAVDANDAIVSFLSRISTYQTVSIR